MDQAGRRQRALGGVLGSGSAGEGDQAAGCSPGPGEQGDGLAGEALEYREPALVISERERRAVAIAAGARRAGGS